MKLSEINESNFQKYKDWLNTYTEYGYKKDADGNSMLERMALHIEDNNGLFDEEDLRITSAATLVPAPFKAEVGNFIDNQFVYNPNMDWRWLDCENFTVSGDIGNLLSDSSKFSHMSSVPEFTFIHLHGKIENVLKIFEFGYDDDHVILYVNRRGNYSKEMGFGLLIMKYNGHIYIGHGQAGRSVGWGFLDDSRVIVSDEFNAQGWMIQNGYGDLL